MLPPIVIVGGPTASGKSALALRVAEAFGGAVVNADSMQVYRDLAVLTARPGPAELARAPHLLYGVLDGGELCSAARWRALALEAIADASAAGRLPILTGGTGLYLRALLHGLAEIPEIPEAVRAEARALHAQEGGDAFRGRLAAVDPEAAKRLPAGDTQRLIRAYEVVVATRKTLREWQSEQQRASDVGPVLALTLLPPRPLLYAAADHRFAAMVKVGALAEVRRLVDRRLDPALPVMKAVGVPELARHLAGEIALEEAIRLGQQATRRYAKRQYTWFRHQLPEAHRIEAQFSESLLTKIFPIIRHFLLTAARPAE
jgi:tRNA dimethylallyltransferase